MKILQVIKTNRGATWAFNQAKYLKNLGVEIITVLPDCNEGYAEKYKQLGMEVIKGDWEFPITKPWRIFSKSKEIKRIVKEIAPDIIHLHFVTNALMCRLALRKDSTPRFFQVPGPLHLENKLINFVERHTATKVDYWGGACKKTCSIYAEKGILKEHIFLTYYGVPQQELFQKNENKLHSEFLIAEDKIIVAMVCYFYKPKKIMGQTRGLKGHEDFIDAMKIVLEKYNNVVPVIIGNAWDGAEDYEKVVRKYAEDRLGKKVIFTGYRNDIYNIYQEIDIAVHPSHSENLGGAAESLLLGIPTISSDVGGFPDIVIPNETGCLVKAKNPKDLAEKIDWVIENSEKAKEMALNGQNLVKELLNLQNTATRVYETYLEILNYQKNI